MNDDINEMNEEMKKRANELVRILNQLIYERKGHRKLAREYPEDAEYYMGLASGSTEKIHGVLVSFRCLLKCEPVYKVTDKDARYLEF